ncbi:MAG: 23S rRNA (adenine(2503)-C(2))-methyltransferase RlmN [Patescibacteria group bacterium]
MELTRLQTFLAERKEPAYRLAQVTRAYFVDLAGSWDGVTVFSKTLRDACALALPWDVLTTVKEQESENGRTVKFLFRCADEARIETVLLRHEDGRNTVCVSSQVGCAMACGFCATGAQGFQRNLTMEEVYEQAIQVARFLQKEQARVTHIVVMGMGEPFHNYDAVLGGLKLLNRADGFGLGARHMTVSTCGIVPGILRLADEAFQVNLAISLHAATSAIRSEIMPVNRAYPLDTLMKAVQTYMDKTNRRVTFEYLLLRDVNDGPAHARELVDLLSPMKRLAHVNLIKYHKTGAFTASDRETRDAFLETLRRAGINATHRVTFGEDIDASCGQLAGHRA